VDSAPRTPGRAGDPTPEEQGWLHCGPSGAGHFVKMVHNGIEYGLMQAYAEGLNVLKHANVGKHAQETDAETTPLRDPDLYMYDLDIAAVTELWRRGSVISSWLLDLTAQALHETPELDEYAGRVSDSGEGRWTVQAAVEEGVPAPVLAASLFNRFASRGEADFGDRVLSAMRHGFGGHLGKSPDQWVLPDGDRPGGPHLQVGAYWPRLSDQESLVASLHALLGLGAVLRGVGTAQVLEERFVRLPAKNVRPISLSELEPILA